MDPEIIILETIIYDELLRFRKLKLLPSGVPVISSGRGTICWGIVYWASVISMPSPNVE